MASSCVPASPFESPRRPLTPGDLQGLLRRRRVIGLAEMMNFPGVIAGDPAELEKLALDGAEHVDGHAPGVLGKALNAYAAAGIRSDHEALTVEEGRRAAAGRHVAAHPRGVDGAEPRRRSLPLVARVRHRADGVLHGRPRPRGHRRLGHINQMVRKAVAAGVAPEDALVLALATTRPRGIGLDHLGAIAPGYQADLVVLPDLESFDPELVLKAGRPVAEIPEADVPDWVKHTVRIAADLGRATSGFPGRRRQGARDRARPGPGRHRASSSRSRPSWTAASSPIPRATSPRSPSSSATSAPGGSGSGSCAGSACRRGALASTVAHDAHNIVVVGVDDDDMARAVQRLVELGGGIVVVE